MGDFRHALRSLREHPGFAVTTIATLALGIGATTAIFSVVNAVLLRPLPYASAERLTLIWIDTRARGVTDLPFSGPGYTDLRAQSSSFGVIAGVTPFKVSFALPGVPPEQIRVLGATPNLLATLGSRVVIGRDFTDADAVAPVTPAQQATGVAPTVAPSTVPTMVILSHSFWQRRFGGDPNVIGRSADIGGTPAMIVGVAEPGFQILFPPSNGVDPDPDLIAAQRIDYASAPRLNPFVRLIGRLKPGVTLAAANQDVERVATDARNRFPIIKAADAHYRVEGMHDDLVADVRPAILSLMGAVVFVLLIACANVGNLLLVRASARERELTIRAALGGSSARLIRQLLSESAVLAAVGTAAGLALAWAGIRLLASLTPANLPRLDTVQIDGTVLLFTSMAALLAASLFGIVPAVRASRVDLASALRAAGRTPSLGGTALLRRTVVIAEVALSFVLLVGAGLMLRSFVALENTDPGFDPRGVLTFALAGPAGKTPDQAQAFVTQLRTTLAALPNVRSVTAGFPFPLDGTPTGVRWGPEDAASDPSKFQSAAAFIVLPGFFEALETRVIAGRTFTEDDNRADFSGLVIDEKLAAKAFRGANPIGQRLLVRSRAANAELLTVIGVVAHQRHQSLAVEGREELYLPDRFVGAGTVARWAVRLDCYKQRRCDPTSIASSVRRIVTELDPLQAVAEMQPMTNFVDRAMSGTRFALVLISVFSAIAAMLACVGLYGVQATAVRQRTAEIGLRMTCGATTRSIFGLVIGQGMKLSLAGLTIGFGSALALTRTMRTMLIGVAPEDPRTYAAIVAVFLLISVVACWVPARRAATLDPAQALRGE